MILNVESLCNEKLPHLKIKNFEEVFLGLVKDY